MRFPGSRALIRRPDEKGLPGLPISTQISISFGTAAVGHLPLTSRDDAPEMKTIGIIGGMGWPSSEAYYKLCNQLVGQKLGSLHCAELVLVQTDFDKINTWESEGRWDKLGNLLVSLAQKLDNAGADLLVIACNTAHKTLPRIQHQISLPTLNIVDITSAKVKRLGFKTVGFVGTIYTMRDNYFRGPLTDQYGIKTITPTQEQQEMMQRVCEQELVHGCLSEASRAKFRVAISELVDQGCEAIILACTEFGRYLHKDDSAVPLIDTLTEHVEAAVDRALA